MQQFGGKPKKYSSDSKRHFTIVMAGKEHGLYVSSTPSSAAKKAVTKLCGTNKRKKVEFHIREITQGSKKKTYGPYTGYIEKLNEPIELKSRVIRYKPVAKLSRKKNSKKIMKGGEKTREDLLRVANEWIGHGTYIIENNNISLIVENESWQKKSDTYIPNDFIIVFTNYGQFEPVRELYDFLFAYSSNRYKEKTLSMNCWQFVFLCLLESGYINEEQLKKLYLNFDNNPNRNKKMRDYFSKEYSVNPEPGDIILFQRKSDKTIWHIGILSEIIIKDGIINFKYIEMLGDKVYMTMTDGINNQKYNDNILFIKPENLLKSSLSNSVMNDIKPATYDKIFLRFFLVNNYFEDDILRYTTQKWEDYIKTLSEPINYEELLKVLDPKQYNNIKRTIEVEKKKGINYTRGNEKYYEERCRELFIRNPEFHNDILRSHNLLRFVV
jgi:hypothetical protein